MSNEVVAMSEPADELPKPKLVLIDGDDDLVCIDDTCFPTQMAPAKSAEQVKPPAKPVR